MVHVTSFISKNSVKIAGASRYEYEINDLVGCPKSTIDTLGTNIHDRKTLHHCMGGITPESGHGCTFSILGKKYKPISPLYNNPDNMAYLDLMSNFQGQIIGGIPDDVMTFGDHTYGKGSIVILPFHRLSAFETLNPDFQGEKIIFDPQKIRLHKKVEEVIQSKTSGLTYREIMEHLFFASTDAENEYTKRTNQLWLFHNQTSFRTLEHLLKPYYNQIDLIQSNSASPLTLIPADRIECDRSIIEFFFEDVIEIGKKTLSHERQQTMREWRIDTLSWLDLFSFDADLRRKKGKTIFQTEIPLHKFINCRSSWIDLENIATQLSSVQSKEFLNLKASVFFPEFLSNGRIFQSDDTEGNLLNLENFSTLIQLSHYLIEKGYADEGHTLVTLKILKDVEQKFRQNVPVDKGTYKLLQESILNIDKLDRLIPHLEQFKNQVIASDNSFLNKKSLEILNSDLGKYIRNCQGDFKEILTYSDLVNLGENLTILFKNPKKNLKEDKELELKFIRLVKEKVWERSFMNPSYFETNALVIYHDESNSLLGSINFNPFTINGLHKMAVFVKHTSFIVSNEPLNETDRWLPTLIQLGCCDSWEDLICKILPLENISELEMKAIIKHNVRLECEFSGKPIPHILKNLSLDKIDRWIKKYLGEVAKHQSYTVEIIEELRKNRKNFNPENHSFGDIVNQVNEVEKRMVIDSCRKHPYFYYRLDKTGNTDKLIIEPDVEQSKLLREHLAQRFDRASPAIKRVYQTHLNRLYKSPFDKAA